MNGCTFIISLVIAILSFGYFYDVYKCSAVSGKMKMEYDYGIVTGCMIEYKKDKWIKLDKFRGEAE